MAYDEGLAERIRDFEAIIIRCPPEGTTALLKEEGVRPFEMRGKAMQGWVLVEAEQVAEEPELKAWIERSRAYVRTLPAK